jgi:Icc-related predicted phosphoesterase
MDTTELATALPNIKTRFLIISDTHGMEFSPEDKPLKHADVAIHCGDLTDGSKLDEFRTAIRLLKDIDAPLKLVIAGNHDFTMDIPAFEKKVAEVTPPLAPDLVVKEYGAHGEARQLFEEIKDAGFVFLDEGNHCLTLKNGALLTVYVSPWTPALGAWGFQYHPERGHDFSIKKGVDVVVTHGPPKGIMDYTYGRERAGCPNLFAAVARARPRLHCFGHIHEGWGAKLVTWRHDPSENPSHFTDIDNERSFVVEKLAGLKQSRFDTLEAVEAKLKKMEHYTDERCCATSHCTGDANPLEWGAQTLFVNASITGTEDLPTQKPWLVDIELPRAG